MGGHRHKGPAVWDMCAPSSRVYSVFPIFHRWVVDNVSCATRFQVKKIIEATHYRVKELSSPTNNHVETTSPGSYVCATQQTGPA